MLCTKFGWNCQMVLEKIFKSCRCIFTIISHGPSIEHTFTQGYFHFVLSLVKIGPVAQEKMKIWEVFRQTEAHFKSFQLRWAKNYTVYITKCNSFKVYSSVNKRKPNMVVSLLMSCVQIFSKCTVTVKYILLVIMYLGKYELLHNMYWNIWSTGFIL